MFVHGGAHGAWCWERVLPHLELPARAMDLPGRGTRPAPLESVTLDDWVEAVVEEITQSGDESTILVGHSLAGITMPRVVDRIPERLSQLIFVSCTVPEEGR
ncbi:MAG: alpha/beta fold hydrolase, partial [Roseibacillus sp.]|nr:alpha/beta fold hydrolase [Roseibacillus sp.]